MGKTNIKTAIAELHTAFHMFDKEFFDSQLPEPAILIQSKGNKKRILGWCSIDKIWANNKEGEKRWEINIVAESLSYPLEDIMCTLLHQMVHLYGIINQIKDSSRNGTYHNKKFKIIAEEHGLYVESDKQTGWGLCKLNEKSIDVIKKYNISPNAFNLSRIDPYAQQEENAEGEPKTRKPSSSRKWICPQCETIIRSTKDVNVICGDCKLKFIKEEDPDIDTEDIEEN